MSKSNDKNTEDRYEFHGVKIAHELMVDILGGLIPGALFLFSLILAVVFPLICYANPNNNFGFLLKDGDWFWIVAFLSFLILSYVIGHIFYRADIKEPDRVDIRREQKKKLMAFIDGMPVGKGSVKFRLKYAANLLYGEVKPLSDALNLYSKDHLDDGDYRSFKKYCSDVVDGLRNLINNQTQPTINPKLRRDILCVLFPEAIGIFDNSKDCQINDDFEAYFPNNKRRSLYYGIAKHLFPEIDELPFRSRSVIINAVRIVPLADVHTGWVFSRAWRKLRFKIRLNMINNNSLVEHTRLYFGKWATKADDVNIDSSPEESFYILMVAYLILHMQNESGCATEKRCDFPYMSYYKYLLKRKQFDLLEYANWATSSSRTKNQINKYKIELQLHVPDAYSIISKNESHIRMASSSWHVAKTIKVISWCMIVVTAILAVLAGIYHSKVESISEDIQKDEMSPVRCCSHGHEEKCDVVSIRLVPDAKHNAPQLQESRNVKSNQNMDSNAVSIDAVVSKHLPFIAKDTVTNCYLAVIFPIFSLLMSLYILNNVPRFIHYQRLREIFYTLKIYKLWIDALKERGEKDKQDLEIRRAAVNLKTPSSEESTECYY